jgi:hypothetical protein
MGRWAEGFHFAAGRVVFSAMRRRGLLEMAALAAMAREVMRAVERGGLLVAVQRGRFVYNLAFEM